MDILSIKSNHIESIKNHTNHRSFAVSQPLKPDSIHFGNITPEQKMSVYAQQLLDENNLKENQPIYITTDSKYLPFVNILEKEAYKKGSGLINLVVIEPALEALKKKYHITEKFDYQKDYEQEFKNRNALFLTINDENNPYKKCRMSDKEIKSEQLKISPQIPKNIRKNFKLEPKEILINSLDLHKGQPIKICGEREHLPFIVPMVDYLYSKNDTKLVDVVLSDKTDLNIYKYAKESVLEDIPQSKLNSQKEMYYKDIALLQLYSPNPHLFDGIDSNRIVKRSKANKELINEYHNKTSQNNPWLVYYLPSLASATDVYSEYKNDPMKALSIAYREAMSINRSGKLEEHSKNLDNRADAMNNLLDKGYKTLHYVSVNPETKEPDGKTDFRITLSPLSKFNAATMRFEKYDHNTIVNIPTEEIFTSPLNNTAEGKISATMPLLLNGKLVEGIEFRFHKGQIVDIKADKNEDMLKEHIKANKNADRLGEVALVAGSPIAKTGRLFKNTLLDENAACHLALGNAYPDTLKVIEDIEDYDEQQKMLKEENINISPTHDDFMVRGPNVYIYAENQDTGDSINIIKDDKFMI